MKVGGSPISSRNARAVLVALTAAFAASCTTSGPGLEMAAPSYNGASGVAALMADVAQSDARPAAAASDELANASTDAGGIAGPAADAAPETAENTTDEALPAQVALLPAASPPSGAATEASAAAPGQTAADPQPGTAAAEPPSDGEKQEAADGASQATEATTGTKPEKRSFLASLFSSAPAASPPAQASFAPAQTASSKPLIEPAPQEEAKPLVDLSEKKERLVTQASFGDALPGVRSKASLFEITGVTDNSTVDLYEDEGAPLLMASAAGLARLAPNGLLKQRESVDVACLKPSLVRILKTVERHYGKRLIVTSGYRSPAHNRRVRGAKRSQHMYCAAADVQVPGVSKWDLARFVRSMPGRGGVGTYCHTESVHIDVGRERDWNWRCGRRSS